MTQRRRESAPCSALRAAGLDFPCRLSLHSRKRRLAKTSGRFQEMPPDFLLVCTVCGSEAVWDTEALPPVGLPEAGHPVMWRCATCRIETRHEIAGEVVITDKLHHDISLATELDRPTVDRVMAEVRRRHAGLPVGLANRLVDKADAVEGIAVAAGVAEAVVRDILLAEGAWGQRRGYVGQE